MHIVSEVTARGLLKPLITVGPFIVKIENAVLCEPISTQGVIREPDNK